MCILSDVAHMYLMDIHIDSWIDVLRRRLCVYAQVFLYAF